MQAEECQKQAAKAINPLDKEAGSGSQRNG